MLPSATVAVLPGFTRSAKDVGLFTRQVADAGFNCFAVDLAPRFLPVVYMYRRNLRRIAAKLLDSTHGSSVVLVGHSAGAAAASYLAPVMRSAGADVKGVVFADGVDSPNHLIRKSLKDLAGMQVGAVLAPPSPCNRQGSLEKLLVRYPWVHVKVVLGAGHGNFEGDEISIYRKFCNDTSTAQIANQYRQAVIEQIKWIACSGES